jgi:hypothetical protein
MNTTPLASDLWEGIAGHFDSITQVLCEFIDNSLSNIESHSAAIRSIRLSFRQKKKCVIIQIEDAGSGISNLEPAMRVGDRTVRETPLNEHGFGLKHALASADPDNKTWKIYTRTKKEYEDATFRLLKAPYSYNQEPEELTSAKWPGEFNGSGTIIQFECSDIFFNTVQRGIQGKAGFQRCLEYIIEEIGYIYAGIIKDGKMTIEISAPEIPFAKTVQAVTPDWAGFYDPKQGQFNIDLGGGTIIVEYAFGEMKASNNYKKHYLRNMATSGAEVRINGRIMASNLFEVIWNIEPHPAYNHFLATFNLISGDRTALPRTRTSKNGIRSGDDKLEMLFEQIRKMHPTPERRLAGAISEDALVTELEKQKNTHIRSPQKKIQMWFPVFTKVGATVKADLYVFDGHDVVIYEAKKDKADVQDLYQLLMYWDGAVADGIKPTEGILIASDFSSGVAPVMNTINSRKDEAGNCYKFTLKHWTDEGVRYPEKQV